MTVHDLWEDLPKAEIARRRKRNLVRWQRRWRGPEIDPSTGKQVQHKESYKEAQHAQAILDDGSQMALPQAQRIRRDSITVGTLLERHLAAKADRAPKTVEADRHHAGVVRDQFGDRVLATIDTTEVEIWSQRTGVARSSRKKQLEIFRAAVKRAIKDGLVDADCDPTEDLVVSLGHKELPHWTSEELMAVADCAATPMAKALVLVMGLMSARRGEARTLKVGDLRAARLSIMNSGGDTDTTKTRASRRVLPVPAALLPLLEELTEGRAKDDWLFPSPRKPGRPVGERFAGDQLTAAIARANKDRKDKIKRLNVHGLRHTFAAIALSEAGANLLAVSRAMGHARPSITLDRYGHLAPAGLEQLFGAIDELVALNAALVRPASERDAA